MSHATMSKKGPDADERHLRRALLRFYNAGGDLNEAERIASRCWDAWEPPPSSLARRGVRSLTVRDNHPDGGK